jgi:hypothetical protein
MKRWTPWLVLVACMIAAGAVWWYRANQQVIAEPPDDPVRLIRRAYTEGRRVALDGRQTVEMGGEKGKKITVTAEVLSAENGDNRIEYVTEPLNGVIIWETGERAYRYNPKLKRLEVAQRRSETGGEEQAAQLLENYAAEVSGSETVAGRSAVVLELRPRSGGDRSKKISVDRETGVILASSERSKKEGTLYSTRFVEIHYRDAGHAPKPEELKPSDQLLAASGFANPGDTSSRFEPAQLSGLVGFKIREPEWLPKGYRFRGAYQTPCHCNRRHQAARLEYSDGLSLITVFECGHKECAANENCFGTDGSSSLAVEDAHGGVRYLAVGDAPREDLLRIVRSIR